MSHPQDTDGLLLSCVSRWYAVTAKSAGISREWHAGWASKGQRKERERQQLNGGLQATQEQELVVQIHLERRANSGEYEADEQARGRADGSGAQDCAGEG